MPMVSSSSAKNNNPLKFRKSIKIIRKYHSLEILLCCSLKQILWERILGIELTKISTSLSTLCHWFPSNGASLQVISNLYPL